MKKAVKLKNDKYLDSKYIVHNKKVLSEILDAEDFTDKVTFNESAVRSHCYFIKQGNMVFVAYQGEAKSHSSGEVIVNIPEGYRPAKNQIFATFLINANISGLLLIESSGDIKINGLSTSNATGRIYANFAYSLS